MTRTITTPLSGPCHCRAQPARPDLQPVFVRGHRPRELGKVCPGGHRGGQGPGVGSRAVLDRRRKRGRTLSGWNLTIYRYHTAAGS